MKTPILALLLVCILMSVSRSSDPPENYPHSREVRAARQQYQKQMETLLADFNKQAAEAKRGYIAQVETALNKAMQGGDLDEVKRLDALQLTLANDGPDAGEEDGLLAPSPLRVQWRQDGSFPLTRVAPVYVKVGWDAFSVGLSDAGEPQPIAVRNRKTTEYIYAHANSRLVYEVPQGARRFTALATTRDASDARTTHFRFIISGDDKLLADTRELTTYSNFIVPIDVEIPRGCRRLILETRSTDNKGMQWSVWAYPQFRRDPR